jgi:hypothetical protein
MFDILASIVVFAAGYAASVYSWPWLRTHATGIAAEASSLRQRAAALENKLRGL